MSMSISNKTCQLLLSSLTIVFLSGCADPKIGELQNFVAEKKSAPPERIEPLPEIRQIETFLYDEAGRRNPFVDMSGERAETASVAGSGLTPDYNRRKEELEGYPLDSLSVWSAR